MTSFGGICLMITIAGLIGLLIATCLSLLNAAVTALSPDNDRIRWKPAVAVYIGLVIALLMTAMLVGAMAVILLYRAHEPTACYWLGIPSAAFPWMALTALLLVQIRFRPLPKWHDRLEKVTNPTPAE